MFKTCAINTLFLKRVRGESFAIQKPEPWTSLGPKTGFYTRKIGLFGYDVGEIIGLSRVNGKDRYAAGLWMLV
jgi:hypothetical protein